MLNISPLFPWASTATSCPSEKHLMGMFIVHWMLCSRSSTQCSIFLKLTLIIHEGLSKSPHFRLDKLIWFGSNRLPRLQDESTEVKLLIFSHFRVYEATLSSSLSNGGKTSLVVTTTFTHSLEPYPRAINQPDNQLVRFHSNAYYYSVYSTVEQFSSEFFCFKFVV